MIYLLLAVATACIFWTWLFKGRALYWGDIGLYFLPMTTFARQQMLHGIIPLWNPHLLCGEPFVGDPQVWLLYPSSLLASLLSAPIYLTVVCVIHIYLAGAFFYIFLRYGTVGKQPLPSLIGALCYMFGGYLASKAQFPNMLQALAYVPLVLLLADRLIMKSCFLRALVLGGVFGLQVLAAHAQVSLLTFYLALAYALWRWRSLGSDRAALSRVLGWSALAGLVGAALSCGQWLPSLELVHHAARQALTLGEANRFYLHTGEITNFVWPFRYGSPMYGNWHTTGNFWEVACFIGVVPLLLALFAALGMGKWRDPLGERRFWVCVFLLSVWLALGRQAGLYTLVFYVLPGMKAFHDPARMLLGAAVALPALAANGLGDLLPLFGHGTGSRNVGIALLAVTAITFGWFDRNLHPLKPAREIEQMASAPIPSLLRSNPSIASGQGRFFMADPYKTWIYFTSYKRYAENDPGFLPHWADTLTPNLGITFGLNQAGGYEPEAVRFSEEAAKRAEGYAAPPTDKRFLPGRAGDLAGLLGEMSARDVVVYRTSPLVLPGLKLIAQSEWSQSQNQVWIYENEQFQPRGRVYTRWNVRTEEVQPLGGAHESYAADLGPDEVEIVVAPARIARLVVIADTLYPGWQATVDGKPAPVLSVDGLYRGVVLPPGSEGLPGSGGHLVRFRYRPEAFEVGLYVTLLAWGLLAGSISSALIRSVWRTRKK